MDSILDHIKNLLGISNTNVFDQAILTAINSAVFTLKQVGVQVPEGFIITSTEQTWTDLLGEQVLESVKTYVFLKTRLEFDPPTPGYLLNSVNKQIDELVSRIYMQVDK